MRISELIEMLNDCKERLGDIEVYFHDYSLDKTFKIDSINAEKDYIDIVGEEKYICLVCEKECFENQYPEVVFKDGKHCICENCSIDYEEVNGKIQLRE